MFTFTWEKLTPRNTLLFKAELASPNRHSEVEESNTLHMPADDPLEHHRHFSQHLSAPAKPDFMNPFTFCYTLLIPYSYTTHIYIHNSDSPQNLVTSKGSLLLPMHVYTRLVVAPKSQESKKRKKERKERRKKRQL